MGNFAESKPFWQLRNAVLRRTRAVLGKKTGPRGRSETFDWRNSAGKVRLHDERPQKPTRFFSLPCGAVKD
jgi:hypothetical protein